MFMFRRTHRRLVTELQRIGDDRRQELAQTRHTVIRQQLELGLVKQAREKAEADAIYWRTRCERFLDQIALRTGIISEPTMNPPPASVEGDISTIFSAIGTSEINHKRPEPRAASAAQVVGVNAADAQAAVDEALAGVGR